MTQQEIDEEYRGAIFRETDGDCDARRAMWDIPRTFAHARSAIPEGGFSPIAKMTIDATLGLPPPKRREFWDLNCGEGDATPEESVRLAELQMEGMTGFKRHGMGRNAAQGSARAMADMARGLAADAAARGEAAPVGLEKEIEMMENCPVS